MSFLNRADAGCQLGQALRTRYATPPIVIGLACDGVPVAAEVARILGARLDICVARKLAEGGVTFGAVAEGSVHFEPGPCEKLRLPNATVDRIVRREAAEVGRTSELLRPGRPLELRGRDVVLVDDGVISGILLRAAIRSIRSHHPRSVELAVPVANAATLDALRSDVDHATCLIADPLLATVGARYRDFPAVTEAEVVALLSIARPTSVDAVIEAARV